MPDGYRLFVNDESTVLVRMWESPSAPESPPVVEVCTREVPGDIWRPPIELKEEK